jgi:hypothetical protein
MHVITVREERRMRASNECECETYSHGLSTNLGNACITMSKALMVASPIATIATK